nr:hypothetical protein [Pandoravirus belohorizontensis]
MTGLSILSVPPRVGVPRTLSRFGRDLCAIAVPLSWPAPCASATLDRPQDPGPSFRHCHWHALTPCRRDSTRSPLSPSWFFLFACHFLGVQSDRSQKLPLPKEWIVKQTKGRDVSSRLAVKTT